MPVACHVGILNALVASSLSLKLLGETPEVLSLFRLTFLNTDLFRELVGVDVSASSCLLPRLYLLPLPEPDLIPVLGCRRVMPPRIF